MYPDELCFGPHDKHILERSNRATAQHQESIRPTMTETHKDEPVVEDMPVPSGKDQKPSVRSPDPAFGSYLPQGLSRLGLAIGRQLPPNQTGLKLAGMARPLALTGLHNGVADVDALGLRLRLHPKDNLSEKRLFMTPQCFDPRELEAVKNVMGPGKVFIDIGANAGAYSLYAANQGGPTCRVIAVEPQREMRQRLAFNARTNDLDQVEMTGVALSDYEGESVLRIVSENLGRTALSMDSQGKGDAVRVTTLPTLLDEMNVRHLDAMKIDVEGGEARILSTYFRDVERQFWPKLIIMERPSVNDIRQEDDAVALACAKGYRVREETRMNAILDLNEQD